MKKHTEDEIKSFFKELYGYEDPAIKVTKYEKSIEINLEQMYDYVPVDFKHLKAVGEFFETDKVNGSKGRYYNGCETCDYGSSYEVDFVIEE